MEYKGVIFDFNGTLFFDNDKHVKAWNEVSKIIRGIEISDEELHNHFNGVPNKEIIQYMFHHQCSQQDITKYSLLKEEYYRRFCQSDLSSFHLVSGAEDYFNQLKNDHIPFTIASASIKENIDFFIQSFSLDKWISPEIIVYDDGSYENKVEMFKDAASKLGVNLADCLIYEDSISGIRSAYQAGCHHIIVINSANKAEAYQKLPGVIKVIDNFDNIERGII